MGAFENCQIYLLLLKLALWAFCFLWMPCGDQYFLMKVLRKPSADDPNGWGNYLIYTVMAQDN